MDQRHSNRAWYQSYPHAKQGFGTPSFRHLHPFITHTPLLVFTSFSSLKSLDPTPVFFKQTSSNCLHVFKKCVFRLFLPFPVVSFPRFILLLLHDPNFTFIQFPPVPSLPVYSYHSPSPFGFLFFVHLSFTSLTSFFPSLFLPSPYPQAASASEAIMKAIVRRY